MAMRRQSQRARSGCQTLEDMDRRTNAYRKTAELIERVEADLGGAERLSTPSTRSLEIFRAGF
jgi:hypothetical protein